MPAARERHSPREDCPRPFSALLACTSAQPLPESLDVPGALREAGPPWRHRLPVLTERVSSPRFPPPASCFPPPSPHHVPQDTFKGWAWSPRGVAGEGPRHGLSVSRCCSRRVSGGPSLPGVQTGPCYREEQQLLRMPHTSSARSGRPGAQGRFLFSARPAGSSEDGQGAAFCMHVHSLLHACAQPSAQVCTALGDMGSSAPWPASLRLSGACWL